MIAPLSGDPAWENPDFRLHRMPALGDHANYIYVLEHRHSRDALVIDPGEATPVEALLAPEGLKLAAIWLTHHHWDHIDGVPALVAIHRPQVVGSAADARRLPPLTQAVSPGDQMEFHGASFAVIDTPGHTLGHIAYHAPSLTMLFSGDTIFSLGSGRLFEGTAEQMFASLQRLGSLPDETIVCAAHEYTKSNVAFARHLDPQSEEMLVYEALVLKLRAENKPTVPVRLGDEKRLNPFLRAQTAEEYSRLRAAKDRF